MNDILVKNILTLYGEKGKAWLDSLPEKIDTYKEKWNIDVLSPFNLSYNYVAPARQKDGTLVVLKIGFPEDKEFKSEINALTLFKGEGICRLIQSEKNEAVMLLEHIHPGIPLSTVSDDTMATKILASVMKKLWKPLPKNHAFSSIYEWTQELREYPHLYKEHDNPPIPFSFIQKAQELFEYLIATSDVPVLVHGDIHHDNVLSSERDGWLAIDPKGIAAEAAYETAVMIRSPYEKIRQSQNLEDIFRKRIILLSKALEIEPQRIHDWCFAQTVLSGVWSRNHMEYTNHALKVAGALERVRM